MATSVIHFSDFTSVQLRYIWGSDDGRDLDTKSYYVNSPINSLNYIAVGWSWNLSQIPYLYWGGDNTDSGAECVMFNIESMIELEDKMPDIMKMNLCANWYGSLSRGHVTVECTAYKGGVIVKAWQLHNNESDVNTRGNYIFPYCKTVKRNYLRIIPFFIYLNFSMDKFIDVIVDGILSNFDFGFMFIVNVLTYIIIKSIDYFNGDNKVPTWQKRCVLVISIAAMAGIYIAAGYDNAIMLVNSAILAPVFWSWVVSPILKKLGVGYKDIDNTIG